jgi:hypothetical protein
MWLAPNMVTLIGFLFILGNIALMEVVVPDLVGPVRCALRSAGRFRLIGSRRRVGCIIALRWGYGCEFSSVT